MVAVEVEVVVEVVVEVAVFEVLVVVELVVVVEVVVVTVVTATFRSKIKKETFLHGIIYCYNVSKIQYIKSKRIFEYVKYMINSKLEFGISNVVTQSILLRSICIY